MKNKEDEELERIKRAKSQEMMRGRNSKNRGEIIVEQTYAGNRSDVQRNDPEPSPSGG